MKMAVLLPCAGGGPDLALSVSGGGTAAGLTVIGYGPSNLSATI